MRTSRPSRSTISWRRGSSSARTAGASSGPVTGRPSRGKGSAFVFEQQLANGVGFDELEVGVEAEPRAIPGHLDGASVGPDRRIDNVLTVRLVGSRNVARQR